MALNDKANVGHRHTTSDVRGGRFPEGMLPSTIVPSIETAQAAADAAQAEAASKSKVVFSALAASGVDFSEGDTWYQRITGIIIAQWEFTGGAWASRTLDGAVVANLDASKITTGTLAAGQTITAGDPEGSRVELDSAGLRKYAADGTTVQVDLTGEVAAFSGLITGSEIIAGTAGAARLELDSAGLRQYAADGTTVLLDTADDATIRARGDNTALGSDAQRDLTTGDSNTAVGTRTQQALTTGGGNAAVGAGAQQALTTGFNNTAVGGDAQRALTVSISNTAVGATAQYYLTTGDRNTAVGHSAQGQPLGSSANKTTTASYQTSIGPETGQSSPTQVDGITTIGYRATAGAANATSIGREARADHAGSIALGYQALTTQPNQVMVGPRDVEITDTTKGLVLVSPDGTRMRITSADDGGLLVNGTPIGGGGGGTTLFADPNADRLVFWDDSVGAFVPLTASTGLTLTGTDLTVRAATDAQTGIVELATTTEATTGTDTARATTPAGVKAALDARTASATVAGIVELATSAETVTGTDTVRATTPAGVKAALAGTATMQKGNTTCAAVAAGGTATVAPVTFPVAFPGVPEVFLRDNGGRLLFWNITPTAAGFTANALNVSAGASGSGEITRWVALYAG